MMVLAEVMKASITWVRCSVQISSLRKLWLCQELVRSTIQRVSACGDCSWWRCASCSPGWPVVCGFCCEL